MKNLETMTEAQARAQKFRPVTSAYLKGEYWMLQNAINDCRRSGTSLCLVKQPGGLELWRVRK